MNLLPGVPLVKIGIYVVLVAFVFGAGVSCEHGRMQKKLDKVTNEYNQFKGGVAALGEAAKKAAERQRLADIDAKRKADENHARTTAALRADVKRLRDTNDSRRGRLPPAPAGSKCPEGQVCFDAAAFERAQRERRDAVRGLVDEGTQVSVDLDVAREWANP